LAALAAFIGVGFGAFGAHALRGRLSPESLTVFETGVRYQMYHAFALLIVAIALARFGGWSVRAAGWFFTLGIVVFSGSLYALALTGVRKSAPSRRLAVSRFLAGWAMLVLGCNRALARATIANPVAAARSGAGRPNPAD
jgi:uncharacterized membrane protein YgdD (TMEM256/DUF423 family)